MWFGNGESVWLEERVDLGTMKIKNGFVFNEKNAWKPENDFKTHG